MSSASTKQNGQAQNAPAEEQREAARRLAARLERIHQYQEDALERPDPLEANLASLSSGMMELGLHLEQKLVRSLARPEVTAEHLHKQQAALEAYLKLMRQVDRYAQLELRAGEAQVKLAEQAAAFAGQGAGKPR